MVLFSIFLCLGKIDLPHSLFVTRVSELILVERTLLARNTGWFDYTLRWGIKYFDLYL
jgi:hypothetical protein